MTSYFFNSRNTVVEVPDHPAGSGNKTNLEHFLVEGREELVGHLDQVDVAVREEVLQLLEQDKVDLDHSVTSIKSHSMAIYLEKTRP